MMISDDKPTPYYGTRVLVLGATGFIGRWVARALSAQRAKLYLTVRDAAAAESIFDRYEINGTPLVIDLRDFAAVREMITTVQPDITFNLAAYGVDRKETDETTAYQINAQLVYSICQVLCALNPSAWRGQSFIHVGSALEYGLIGGNLREDSPTLPTTLYGRSKLVGTQLFVQSCRAYGVRGVTARLFTVYGPGENDDRLVPALIRLSRTDTPLDLTAGDQKRDFIYVEDVAEALLRLGLANAEWGEIVNVATGKLTDVRRFVETAACVMGVPANRLNFGVLPYLMEEMHHSRVPIDKLQNLTGWSPLIDIETGFRKTLEFSEREHAGKNLQYELKSFARKADHA